MNRNEKAVHALTQINYAAGRLRSAQQQIDHYVTSARKHDASWSEIAVMLGITKQAAQQKYARKIAAQEREQNQPETLDEPPQSMLDAEAQITAADFAGPSVTPSIFLDPIAPAVEPAPSKETAQENALQAHQERIYRGETYSDGGPLDWKADADPRAAKKCPYCEQPRHFNTKTGDWYVYRGCKLTGKDYEKRKQDA